MSKVSNATSGVASAASSAKSVAANGIKNMKNGMKTLMTDAMSGNCYLIIVYLVSIIFLIIFSYSFYLRREFSKAARTRKKMRDIYDIDTGKFLQLKPLEDADYNTEGDYGDGTYYALIDYYIKSSYNSCCTGPAVNGWVDPEALKTVIRKGVRFLDFEIYLKKNKAVVAVQKTPYPETSEMAGCTNCKFKDSLNELDIVGVLDTVKLEAIQSAGCRNNTDPLILNFRILSENDAVYDILAHAIKKTFRPYLMPANYGYCGKVVKSAKNDRSGLTGNGKDIFSNNVLYSDLKNLKQKVLIFARGPHNDPTSYRRNRKFYELMNGGAEDGVVLYKTDYTVKNSTKSRTIDEHRNRYCITIPDITTNNNSQAPLHMNYGCQAITMNFGAGFNDTSMEYYKKKFSDSQKAFILKPRNLRRRRVFAGKPTPPDPRLDPIQKRCIMDVPGYEGTIDMGNIPMGASSCN
tara:strand:+ start:3349 stop:4737 length:1389 start_codon:yes stop_codon:yes gene_type:complete